VQQPPPGASGSDSALQRQQVRWAASTSSGTAKRVRKEAKKLAQRVRDASWRFAKKTRSLVMAFLRDPRIVAEWYEDIRDAVVHFVKWVVTGFRLFGSDFRASYVLMTRVAQGYALTVRERRLLVRTTSDCLKLIPFSFFIIVPFAEVLLPFFLRFFPNMLPSTFFERKYDNATLARKLKAKEEMAEFWQQVVLERTREISDSADHKFADKASELQTFQEKCLDGQEFPSLKEILRFSRIFQEEFSLTKMSRQQLAAMSKMLGLQVSRWWPGHTEVLVRHHINNLRSEDRDLQWEGIDSLTKKELIEACRKRAIRFHEVTEDEMRKDLTRWLELSSNRKIPTSLLLWIQSFYLRQTESEPDLKITLAGDDGEATPDNDPKEAFQGFADRQKAHLEDAQVRLENLKQEIDDVLVGSSLSEPLSEFAREEEKTAEKKAEQEKETEEAEQAEEPPAHEERGEEKRRLLKENRDLHEAMHLYRQVTSQQKGLLEQQLRFIASMHDNTPTLHKDPDVILLDQRIRLLEMVGVFKKTMEEIEELMSQADMDSDQNWGDLDKPLGRSGRLPKATHTAAGSPKAVERDWPLPSEQP